jgi:dTMP kinase
MKKGLFIALEGIDYCGKDTQIEKILSWFEELRLDYRSSSEPNGNNPEGADIRLILQGKKEKPEDLEFQRMYVLDRRRDILERIKPALDAGKTYLINRYALSTIAYGMLSGKPAETFFGLHDEILGSSMIWPDVTILMDISAKESMRRLTKTKNVPESFEKLEFLEKIRKNYLSLVKHPRMKDHPIAVVNGERTEDEVFEDIRKIIVSKLPPL